jgi:hypothetical protein
MGETKKTTIKKMTNGYKTLYKSPTYNSWACMKCRCDCKNTPYYKDYGGRGITYSEKWATFKGFLDDMGERPEGCTLDRIDVNGNYCKENCRWATKSQQQHNMRTQKRPLVGVRFDSTRKASPWACRICAKGRQYASRKKTLDEALKWRKKMEEKLWEQQ